MTTARRFRLAKADADRCHSPSWSEPEIAAFTARLALFKRRGMATTDADDFAERLTLRDRDDDDRRACIECQHLGDAGCAAARAGHLTGIARRCRWAGR